MLHMVMPKKPQKELAQLRSFVFSLEVVADLTCVFPHAKFHSRRLFTPEILKM